jgi:hypothetical protein
MARKRSARRPTKKTTKKTTRTRAKKTTATRTKRAKRKAPIKKPALRARRLSKDVPLVGIYGGDPTTGRIASGSIPPPTS